MWVHLSFATLLLSLYLEQMLSETLCFKMLQLSLTISLVILPFLFHIPLRLERLSIASGCLHCDSSNLPRTLFLAILGLLGLHGVSLCHFDFVETLSKGISIFVSTTLVSVSLAFCFHASRLKSSSSGSSAHFEEWSSQRSESSSGPSWKLELTKYTESECYDLLIVSTIVCRYRGINWVWFYEEQKVQELR